MKKQTDASVVEGEGIR
ncbi:Protein of unknown function [Thermobacillus xylanilyticus]|uniref:Uncharacterized protein n=1 Tax=Thermobacillus xylanilyticus TaxID=76633 RepID=A0ABM8V5Y5_THEXY|nr:Protein of unknown function [Thermobacillus xylanilyticus]